MPYGVFLENFDTNKKRDFLMTMLQFLIVRYPEDTTHVLDHLRVLHMALAHDRIGDDSSELIRAPSSTENGRASVQFPTHYSLDELRQMIAHVKGER